MTWATACWLFTEPFTRLRACGGADIRLPALDGADVGLASVRGELGGCLTLSRVAGLVGCMRRGHRLGPGTSGLPTRRVTGNPWESLSE